MLFTVLVEMLNQRVVTEYQIYQVLFNKYIMWIKHRNERRGTFVYSDTVYHICKPTTTGSIYHKSQICVTGRGAGLVSMYWYPNKTPLSIKIMILCLCKRTLSVCCHCLHSMTYWHIWIKKHQLSENLKLRVTYWPG